MAHIKFERPFKSNEERILAETLKSTCAVYFADDCRRMIDIIRNNHMMIKLDMVCGAGGSHIWIHRCSEFSDGDQTNERNKRFAIITDQPL